MSGASRRHRLATSRGPERPRPPSNGSRAASFCSSHSTVEMPDAPNGVCVYGRDAANRTGNSIEGRWEYDEGNGWQTDFDLVHTGALGSLDHVAGAGFQVAAGATATKAAKELGLVRTESAECC